MADPRSVSKRTIMVLATLFCAGLWSAALCGGDPAGETSSANRIINVRPYAMDSRAGSMGLRVLESVIESQSVASRYEDLVPLSGAVFRFVYDSTEAYEPLRDACPFDLLRNAAVRRGFIHAHWETGLSLDEAKQLIKEEIDAGRPLISPFLDPEAYHGFNIITGYDYDQGVLQIKAPSHRVRPATIPIPDGWDGPTESPAGWATNPLFIIGNQVKRLPNAGQVDMEIVREGIGLLEGGRLEYGRHPGEWKYMGEPGPHEATYGIPAYEVLAADVQRTDLIVNRGGERQLNFGLVWRVASMMGLLEHDRTYGDQFGTLFKGFLSKSQAWALSELVGNLESTAADAARVRDVFWHEIPDSINDPDYVVAGLDTCEAVVIGIPDDEALVKTLRDRGYDIYDTAWGPALVNDSSQRRLQAKLKVIAMMSRERETLRLLRRIDEFLEGEPEAEPAGPETK